jgi:hypothetical protein
MEINMEINNKLRCELCNKNYNTLSGLWKHNNKYHIIHITQIPQIIPQNPTYIPQNPTLNNLECKKCNKILSRYDSLKRHELKCKNNNITKNELDKMKEEIRKDIMNEIIKNCKIHPKTLQKINNQLVNNNTINNINNNINNGTINNKIINNINIVKFGSENIKEILNEEEIKMILNSRYTAIEESIKKVHFNDDKPEYRNIYITNLRDNIAYVYNGKQFEGVQKHSVINDLIDQHMNNIEVSLETYKDKLSEKSAKVLDKLLEKLNDEETKMKDELNNKEYKNYKLCKINEIKLMIYNETGKNTEVIKLKYCNPDNNTIK